MSLLADKQLEAIARFGSRRFRLDIGPFRCGKTFSKAIGFGELLRNTPIEKFGYAIVSRTVMNVRLSALRELESNYGNAIKINNNSSVGTIFGHPILLGGLNDKDSVRRIQGTTFRGIWQLEPQLATSDHFELLQGRLSGESSTNVWYEGDGNPDSPSNYLYKKIQDGLFDYTQWRAEDAVWKGAEEYYTNLRKTFKDNPSYLARYVNGEWVAADNLVYMGFNLKSHVLSPSLLIGARYKYYHIAIDYGTDNPTAILLIGIMPAGERIVLKETYIRTTLEHLTTEAEVVNYTLAMMQECNGTITKVYVDPSAKSFRNALTLAGVYGVTPAINDVEDGINKVMDFLGNDRLFIVDTCTNLISEMVTYSRTPDGKIIKKHDHGPDALRYEIYTSALEGDV